MADPMGRQHSPLAPGGYGLVMTDQAPDPVGGAMPPPPPPQPAVASVGGTMAPVAARPVPARMGGAHYSPGLVILLMFVTLGIWGMFWTWRTAGDLKRYNGDGLGSGLSLLLYIILNIVLWFTIPNEIKQMYERDGKQSPISAVWGLWFLLPLIGNFVWYIKVQRSLNSFWLEKGAQPG
jgi:hypothetical protein